MVLMPMGDFYVWYCDWCDSRNLTLWTKVEKNSVSCCACHKTFAPYEVAETVPPIPPRHNRYQMP